ESFSETCETCAGRGLIVHHDPVFKHRGGQQSEQSSSSGRGRRGRGGGNGGGGGGASAPKATTHEITDDVRNALAKIAAKTVQQDPPAEPAAPAAAAAEPAPVAEPVAAAPVAAPVEILDIPIEPVIAEKPRPVVDPEVVLGSVLDALPEPKKAGQDRKTAAKAVPQDPPAEPAAPAAAAAEPAPVAEPVAAAPVAAPVEILDIPIEPVIAEKPRPVVDPEVVLGSVLDALPEPKKAG